MQSDTPSTVIWSKARWDVKFQLADGCFSKPEVVISQPWIKICRWNWFGDRRWPSEDSYHQIGNRIGSSMEPPRPPSWKCIWRNYSAVGVPIGTQFGNLIQNSTQKYDLAKIAKGRRIPTTKLKIVLRHICFVFLMQFGLWRAATRVSSPIHLLEQSQLATAYAVEHIADSGTVCLCIARILYYTGLSACRFRPT